MIWPRDVFFLSVWQEGINYDSTSPPAFFWIKQANKELDKKRGSGFHPAYYLETQNGGLSISRNNF